MPVREGESETEVDHSPVRTSVNLPVRICTYIYVPLLANTFTHSCTYFCTFFLRTYWYVFTYIHICTYNGTYFCSYIKRIRHVKCTYSHCFHSVFEQMYCWICADTIRATCRYEYLYVQLQSGIGFRPFLRPNHESGSIDLLHTFCQTLLGPSPGHALGGPWRRRRDRRLRLESASESVSIAHEILRTSMSH